MLWFRGGEVSFFRVLRFFLGGGVQFGSIGGK